MKLQFEISLRLTSLFAAGKELPQDTCTAVNVVTVVTDSSLGRNTALNGLNQLERNGFKSK
jgi:hypothetical protein